MIDAARKAQIRALLRRKGIDPAEVKHIDDLGDVRFDELFEDMEKDDILSLMREFALEDRPTPTAARPSIDATGKVQRPAAPPPAAEPAGTADKRDKAVEKEHLTAPYRFVPLAETVVEAGEPVEGLDFDRSRPIPTGFSGSITVEWQVETPLLIGQNLAEWSWSDPAVEAKIAAAIREADAKREAPVDRKAVAVPAAIGPGAYVIPGATLKGLIRAGVEIVARARLGDGNHHHRYGLRNFEHPKFKGGGQGTVQRLSWEQLGAGFLRLAREGDPPKANGDSDYVLEICDKRMVRMEDLLAKRHGPQPSNPDDPKFGEYAERLREWLGTKLLLKYSDFGMSSSEKRILVRKTRPHTFALDRDGRFATFQPGGKPGVLVFAGKSPTVSKKDTNDEQKKIFADNLFKQLKKIKNSTTYRRQEYVFFRRADATARRVPEKTFEQFRRLHSKPGKTAFKPDGSWKDLAPTVEAGLEIPVFFAGAPGVDDPKNPFEIGLTRLFKVAHEFSVGEVIQRHHRAHAKRPPGETRAALDIVEALFGYVEDEPDPSGARRAPREVARASRVSFGFAKLAPGEPKPKLSDVRTGVMMGPRASFAPFYLEGEIRDWSEPTARLMGRKRYFPRFHDNAEVLASAAKVGQDIAGSAGNEGEDAHSRMIFLEPADPARGLRFGSEIRFHNVTAAEIGAVLWVLTHGGARDKPFRHMIGRGKPFGAGQTRVARIDLAGLKAHGPAGAAALEPAEPWEIADAAGRGWVEQGGRSLGPFLRAFDKVMTGADPGWATSPDLQGFLASASPRLGAEAVKNNRAGYLSLKRFQTVRARVQLKASGETPAPGQTRRFLDAGEVAAARPYLKPR